MRESVREHKDRPWWGAAVVLTLLVLAVGAMLTMPLLSGWLVDAYTRLAEGRPADFDLPVLMALLAVALIIGWRARVD